MKIIKTTLFAKWAKKNKIDDSSLYNSAKEISQGRYDANYGGSIFKKRIATKGRGKSSSVRIIIAFKKGKNCFYIYDSRKVKKAIFPKMKRKL